MAEFARSGHHGDVLRGLEAATRAGFEGTKLNTVVVRGYNDDEIVAIARYARDRGFEPRFIEYMDVGGATQWSVAKVVPRNAILTALCSAFGDATALPRTADPHAPAERYRFAEGLVAGIVASTTQPFCRDCDRARLTADGTLFLCLYAGTGLDLRTPLREGASDELLAARIQEAWQGRAVRGAEERAALPERGVLVSLETLRADPRQEMHVRGG
jgi:cyclic pyranopterin phosphate synthase